MKRTLLKFFILFLSIPLINSIAFGIGTLFHEMHQATITQAQFAAYENAMIFMIILVGLSILIVEYLSDWGKLTHQQANLIYLGSFLVIGIVTWDQFIFRPYEHSLTYLSVWTVIPFRSYLNAKLMQGSSSVSV